MKEMSMKTVSNVMAGVGIAIVMGSFILNAAGLTHIAMTDTLRQTVLQGRIFASRLRAAENSVLQR